MPLMSPSLLVEVFIATVILTLLAFEAGLRIGRWRSERPHPEPQLPVRALVASILSLLAFILGFTFGLASSHFDSRSQAVLDEAIAIGTAYHRTDFLPEPERADLQRLLREYIDLRLQVGRQEEADGTIPRLRHLQQKIWAEAVAAGKQATGPLSAAPFLQSLTDVFDVHGERALAGIRSRIPFTIWTSLYAIMMLSVGSAGYLAGLAGARRSMASVPYALVFAAVITMIAAGDIPGTEQYRASHSALMDLKARLTIP
jgi:hypothetical protein